MVASALLVTGCFAAPAAAFTVAERLSFGFQGNVLDPIEIGDLFGATPGLQFDVSANLFAGPFEAIPEVTVIPSVDLGPLGRTPEVKTPALVIERSGASLGFGTEVTLPFSLSMQPGSLDVQVPLDVTLTLPDGPIAPGQTFTVGSQIAPISAAGLSLGTPSVTFGLDATFGGFFDAQFELLGNSILDDLFPVPAPGALGSIENPNVLPLLNLSSPQIGAALDLSTTLQGSSLVQQGTVPLDSLAPVDFSDLIPFGLTFGQTAEVPVPGAILDFASLVLDILGLPSDFFDDRTIGFEVTLLDLMLGLDIPFSQRTALHLDQGQLSGTLRVGDRDYAWIPGVPLEVQAPSVLDGDLEIEAILDFEMAFETRISFDFRVACNFDVLGLEISIPFGVPDVSRSFSEDCSPGPFFDEADQDDLTLVAAAFDLDLGSDSILASVPTTGGFNALAAVPEPAPSLLTLVVLAGLAATARRTRSRRTENDFP